MENFNLTATYWKGGRNHRAVFISRSLAYARKHDLELGGLEALWIEIRLQNSTTILIGTFYRPPNADAVYQ